MILKTSEQELKLVIVPSRLMAIYMIGYIEEFGYSSRFDVYFVGSEDLPDYLIDEFKLLGCRIVSRELSLESSYSELIIHSFASFQNHLEFLHEITYEKLTLFSDGFRNGMLHLLPSGVLISKLIYFGFILSEKTFERKFDDSSEAISKEVVSFQIVKATWKRILNNNAIHFKKKFKSGDLLIVMRYWNDEKHLYKFKSEYSVLDYLIAEVKDISCDRVIIKSHPWYELAFEKSSLEQALGKEVIIWEDWVDFSFDNSDHSELFSPEALMWTGDTAPDYLFAFDSSLNTLAALNWRSTQSVLPSRKHYEKFFASTLSSDFVAEQTNWILDLTKKIIDAPHEEHHVRTEGGLIEVSILHMIIFEYRDALIIVRDALTQERDALTQERDALTQERDALTQEYDALTQEYDALINSTIWRTTRFARDIVSLIKRLRKPLV